jgi:hypothetical protein
VIHEAPGADYALAEARAGQISAVENVRKVGNARTGIGDQNFEKLGLAISNQELDRAVGGVTKSVARKFAGGCGQADLLLVLEAKQGGNLPGTLPRLDNVPLLAEPDCKNRKRFVHCHPF